MTTERRAMLKRMLCLVCSLGTMVCYSYLIGGVGGYLFGKGKPLAAAAGFAGGTALAAASFAAWRSYLREIGELPRGGGDDRDGERP